MSSVVRSCVCTHRSLLFAFATVIIHSCFQTSREDPNINEASSYLDLSPLYVRPLRRRR